MKVSEKVLQKIYKADTIKIDEEAIKDFLQKVKKFVEEHPEVKVYEIS